jgi:hypothetical protein
VVKVAFLHRPNFLKKYPAHDPFDSHSQPRVFCNLFPFFLGA